MQSNAQLALQIEAQGGELNDYEDEESEYKDYSSDDDDEYTFGEEQRTEHESSFQLENDLPRAAFGDLVNDLSASSSCGTMCSTSKPASRELELEEEKLLDMLRRRLFQKSSGLPKQFKAPSSKQQHSSSVSSPVSSSQSGCNGARGGGIRQGQKSRQIQDQPQLIYSLGPAVDPSISPEKIGKMVQRFRLQEEKRARKLRAKREEAESTEVRREPRLSLSIWLSQIIQG